MDSLRIILGPIITEKSMSDASKGKYTFRVLKESGKKEIKKAIEEKFKVNVTKISTTITKGRSAKAGIRRLESLKPAFKKAMVKVKEGQTIGLFDAGSK